MASLKSHLHVFPADVSVQEVGLGLCCQISVAPRHLNIHQGDIHKGHRQHLKRACEHPSLLKSPSVAAGQLDFGYIKENE